MTVSAARMAHGEQSAGLTGKWSWRARDDGVNERQRDERPARTAERATVSVLTCSRVYWRSIVACEASELSECVRRRSRRAECARSLGVAGNGAGGCL